MAVAYMNFNTLPQFPFLNNALKTLAQKLYFYCKCIIIIIFC